MRVTLLRSVDVGYPRTRKIVFTSLESELRLVFRQDGVVGAVPGHPPAHARCDELHGRQAVLRPHGPPHRHLAAPHQQCHTQVLRGSCWVLGLSGTSFFFRT